MTKITRMQLLRGDIKGKNNPFRPPWAIPEEYFVDFCTRCDKCVDVCFDELIVKGRGGFPQMDFNRGGCDFCEDCLNVCETSALKKIPINTEAALASKNRAEASAPESYLPPWHIKANIDLANCLSMNATICRSCGESCDDEAIKFDLKLGGIAEPKLNIEHCTGCGACFTVCPVHAVTLTPITLMNESAAQEVSGV